MALLNSGDSMALLAKELNPFSISPIMFCQIATGSLLLSATGVLQHDREGFGAPPVLSYHTVATRRSTLRASILPLPRCHRAFCGAKNRVIEASSQYHSASQGNSQGECISPPAAADRPRQRHRPLLRNLRRRRSGADAADHGAGRSDDPLG